MKNKGFTLIEITITLVIIGVISSFAAPAIVGQIETSRATEALQIMGALKRSVETCITTSSGDTSACSDAASLDVVLPSGSTFAYSVGSDAGNIILSATKTINSKLNKIAMTITTDADGNISTALSATPANSPYLQIVNKINNNMNGSGVGGLGRAAR